MKKATAKRNAKKALEAGQTDYNSQGAVQNGQPGPYHPRIHEGPIGQDQGTVQYAQGQFQAPQYKA